MRYLPIGLPFLLLLNHGLFYTAAGYAYGAWPQYGQPDPKSLTTLQAWYWITLFSWPTLPLLGLLGLAVWRRYYTRQQWLLVTVGWVLVALVAYLDPGGVLDWLLD